MWRGSRSPAGDRRGGPLRRCQRRLLAQAGLGFAEHFADLGVTWFEEPVSSDDLEGLRLLRDRSPADMEIAAGEYGYEPLYFRRMLEAGAVDVLQADATRCCGFTGFLRAAALADAWGSPLSAHTAPALHLPVCCAAPRLRHVEWFHDHVRIERMLFDGAPCRRMRDAPICRGPVLGWNSSAAMPNALPSERLHDLKLPACRHRLDPIGGAQAIAWIVSDGLTPPTVGNTEPRKSTDCDVPAAAIGVDDAARGSSPMRAVPLRWQVSSSSAIDPGPQPPGRA